MNYLIERKYNLGLVFVSRQRVLEKFLFPAKYLDGLITRGDRWQRPREQTQP